MKALADIGCKVSLRFRPMMPGLSDRTPRHRNAYQDLIEMCADAGARYISYETCFVPTRFNKEQSAAWDRMERNIGVPLKKIYRELGPNQACLRPSSSWTEQIMHAVHETAHANGMWVGVSDPTWKELNDGGCCCGMPPDDPVFGNWERENATNALVRARDDRDLVLTIDDIMPPWAERILQAQMCNLGTGPQTCYSKKHSTWADKLAEVWNDLKSERGTLSYFQGALQPVQLDNGDVGYTFKGLERKDPKRTPYWSIFPRKVDAERDARFAEPHCHSCGVGQACGGCSLATPTPRVSLGDIEDTASKPVEQWKV